MNWKPSGTGLEPKRAILLGVLLLILVYFLWPKSHNEGDEPATPHTPRASVPPPLEQTPESQGGVATAPRRAANDRGRARDGMEEFRPSLRRVRQANTDPSRIDPTLRLDLLARLQNVKLEGGMRSLFEASDTPPVAINEPGKVLPKGAVKPMNDIAKRQPPPGPPPQPPPPPIPLKFYGFVNPADVKDRRGFFLDGDDIMVAHEGDTLQKRYKVIRIGVSSAVVEDTQFSNQQNLPLVAEAESAG